MASDEDGIAYFHRGGQSFLLQDFYEEDHENNFMMHFRNATHQRFILRVKWSYAGD
jgi:hypothetical protein